LEKKNVFAQKYDEIRRLDYDEIRRLDGTGLGQDIHADVLLLKL
jgi:hypothetical protein